MIPFVEEQPTDVPDPPKNQPPPEGIPLEGLQGALKAHTAALVNHAKEIKKLGEVLKKTNELLAKK